MENKSSVPNESSKSTLIYAAATELNYVNILVEIISNELAAGRTVVVLNAVSTIKYSSVHYLALLRFARKKDPIDRALETFRNHPNFKIIKTGAICKTSYVTEHKLLEELVRDTEILEHLKSTLVSITRNEIIRLNCVNHLRSKRLVLEFSTVFREMQKIWNDHDGFGKILIPNGRFLDQFALIYFSRLHKNLEIQFYEKGFQPNTYFLQQFSPHNLSAFNEFIATASRRTELDILNAREWLQNRQTNSTLNIFVDLQTQRLDDSNDYDNKNAVVFTSSPDEYAYAGDEWKKSTWKNQHDAITSIVAELTQKNISVSVRFHPNGLYKSGSEKRRINRFSKQLARNFPHIAIYGFADGINSYDLVRSAQKVVVWCSTIGAEAIWLGKEVFNLEVAEWSDHLASTQIYGESDLPKIHETQHKICQSQDVERFYAARFLLDNPILCALPNDYILDMGRGIYRISLILGERHNSYLVRIVKILFKGKSYKYTEKIYKSSQNLFWQLRSLL